jgi:hypothetical protein
MIRPVVAWGVAYVVAIAVAIVVFSFPALVMSGVPVVAASQDLGQILVDILPRVGAVMLLPALVLFWFGAKGRGVVPYVICGGVLPALFIVGVQIYNGAMTDPMQTMVASFIAVLPGAVAGLVFYAIWSVAR